MFLSVFQLLLHTAKVPFMEILFNCKFCLDAVSPGKRKSSDMPTMLDDGKKDLQRVVIGRTGWWRLRQRIPFVVSEWEKRLKYHSIT